jgi:hypothetical protein
VSNCFFSKANFSMSLQSPASNFLSRGGQVEAGPCVFFGGLPFFFPSPPACVDEGWEVAMGLLVVHNAVKRF